MANNTQKAGLKKALIPLVLLFGPAIAFLLIYVSGCEHRFERLDDYGVVPAYKLKDASGKVLTNKDFEENSVIFTTIQPTCPDSCGISIWHFDQLIFQKVRVNQKRMKDVRIVSIVTDVNGNPVDQIKDVEFMLKDRVEGYDPKIWMVVSGDPKTVYNITHNNQSLIQKGEQYFGGYSYQELMLLVDKNNHLRMAFPGKTESTIRKMKDYVSLLHREYREQNLEKK